MAVTTLSNAVKNSQISNLNSQIGGGALIEFYSAPKPAGPDTAITTQVKLGTLTGNATAFGDVSGAVLTARAITQDSAADATNTAVWARILTSGATPVIDVDVGTSGATINLNTTAIVAGGPISISSFTFTHN